MTATHDEVSPHAAQALREAMSQLLIGHSRHTNGRLTKADLGREAGLSHATLHRAKTILAEWDTTVATLEVHSVQQPARDDQEATELRARLAKKASEYTELRRRLDAAATVIATLHHENNALRAQLNRQGTVIPLEIHRHGPESERFS